MRDRLAHQYVGINIDFIRNAATTDIPELMAALSL
ncbi:HepT-like ribonuclease domain-containing protein [Luteococcus sp. H138]